jgi:hypothetical protein
MSVQNGTKCSLDSHSVASRARSGVISPRILLSYLTMVPSCENSTRNQTDSPWDPDYPVAKNHNPTRITRAEVLDMLQSGQQLGKDLLLIDLRREDLKVWQLQILMTQQVILTVAGRHDQRRNQYSRSNIVSKYPDSLLVSFPGQCQISDLVLW